MPVKYSGIGYETAKGLALSGYQVILACRSQHKAESSIRKMISEEPSLHLVFKNNNLIDIFGYFNGENNYSNSTYVRSESIVNPNINFDIEEWIFYPNNTFEFIGFHNQNLSLEENIFTDIKIYPIPITNNLLYIKSNLNYFYEIFNINGVRLLNGFNNNILNSVKTINLKSGIYFLKISRKGSYFTQKIIIQ